MHISASPINTQTSLDQETLGNETCESTHMKEEQLKL